MPDRWISYGEHPSRSRHLVAVENVGSVGLELVLSLLDAGYSVVASNVSERYLPEFQAAGGAPARDTGDGDDVAWSIKCHERPGVRPEVLSRLSSARHEHGRPRLELSGSHRSLERNTGDSVARLVMRSGGDSSDPSPLQVDLDVTPRGLQLIVRGERSLFEAALPVLTVLADRVLYAGSAFDDD